MSTLLATLVPLVEASSTPGGAFRDDPVVVLLIVVMIILAPLFLVAAYLAIKEEQHRTDELWTRARAADRAVDRALIASIKANRAAREKQHAGGGGPA